MKPRLRLPPRPQAQLSVTTPPAPPARHLERQPDAATPPPAAWRQRQSHRGRGTGGGGVTSWWLAATRRTQPWPQRPRRAPPATGGCPVQKMDKESSGSAPADYSRLPPVCALWPDPPRCRPFLTAASRRQRPPPSHAAPPTRGAPDCSLLCASSTPGQDHVTRRRPLGGHHHAH